MTEPTARVVVTQSDREAAAITEFGGTFPFTKEEYLSGFADDNGLVQAFAHHRLQGERDGLRKAAEVARAEVKFREQCHDGAKQRRNLKEARDFESMAIAGNHIHIAIRRLIEEESA